MTPPTPRHDGPPMSGERQGNQAARPWLSVIVPALDEAERIGQTLDSVLNYAGQGDVQLIVVDGGSVDGTRQLALARGAVVRTSEPGRARQMNAGASVAHGGVLLFLHADTSLPTDYRALIHEMLAQSNVVGGAFELGIDAQGWKIRLIEWVVSRRSRWLSMPYGDQGIFIRAQAFKALGGYRDQPVMEDYDLMRRARRLGRIGIVRERVKTSARRWLRQGVLCATLTNQMCIIGYHLGVSPRRLARWRDDRCAKWTAKNGTIHDAGSDHGSGRADRAGAAETSGK